MKPIYRSLKLIYHISPKYFIINIILTSLLGMSSALTIFATQTLINGIQIGIKKINEFVMMLLLFGAINLIVSLLSLLKGYTSQKYQLIINNELDILTLNKCKDLSLLDYEKEETYNLIIRANEMGKSEIYSTYVNFLVLMETLLSFGSVSAIIFSINKKLWLLIIFTPIISTLMNIKLGRKTYLIQRKRAKDNRQLGYINYLLTNNIAIKEIISYNCAGYFIDKFQATKEKILRDNNYLLKLNTICNFVLSFLEEIINITVVAVVVISASRGNLLIGDIVAYINSLAIIENNLKSFLLNLSEIHKNKLFIEEFFYFMDTTSDMKKGEAVEIDSIKKMSIKNLYFKYSDDGNEVLRNINFEIDNSRPIAIIGMNGSGKSSLIKVLSGLYDNYEGTILINNTDLRSINKEDYRHKVGVIFQDYNKYEFSMRENLGISQLSSINDDAKLTKVLDTVGLKEVVDRFDNGIDTQMGNWFGGEELSKGQWQRVAIGRIVLRGCEIMVFDEPTSSLDSIMENEIFELIERLSKNVILILITHRMSNLLKFNPRIIILKDGEIVGDGDKYTLSDNPEFNRLLEGKS